MGWEQLCRSEPHFPFTFQLQARRHQGARGRRGALVSPPPQIFAIVDLLPIDNGSEKKDSKNI